VSDAQSAAPQAQPQRNPVEIDDSKAVTMYANVCRAMGTPEELIIDFGLNLQPSGVSTLIISQRVIMNYYAAKRMLQALAVTIQHHEQAFGVLETDPQKRVRPSAVQG